jgi:hypothetical protein
MYAVREIPRLGAEVSASVALVSRGSVAGDGGVTAALGEGRLLTKASV